MLTDLLAAPLKLLPRPLTAVGLGIVLNVFFKRYPELKERLTELSGKIFRFSVLDLRQDFYMLIDARGEVRIHTGSDDHPNVTMAGDAAAFLALLFNTSDPDSLFFSRKLKLSGETDTGLRFKNILDNVDIDWEKELTDMFGPMTAGVLLNMSRQAQNLRDDGKVRAEGYLEGIFEDHATPRGDEMEELQADADALAARVEKLEQRLERAAHRLRLADAGQGAKSAKKKKNKK